jgi:acetyltransferase-like isoleucine patch superfamily enzyme
MIDTLRKIYRKVKARIKFYNSVNWTKTIYFNFKKYPFSIAKKLPVFFYGRVRFSCIKGEIVLDAPIKKAMLGFGQPYELNTRSKGIGEIFLRGTLVCKGHVQFGKDCFIHIAKDAYCEFGHMASLASNGKIICKEKIILGNYARIGSESQLIDTNFHQMINTLTNEKYPMTAPIKIGNYNFISNRVTIMRNTVTPDNCTIASNTLCNKNYLSLGENILIGGIPAKLLRENISRDWDGEMEKIKKYLIVH